MVQAVLSKFARGRGGPLQLDPAACGGQIEVQHRSGGGCNCIVVIGSCWTKQEHCEARRHLFWEPHLGTSSTLGERGLGTAAPATNGRRGPASPPLPARPPTHPAAALANGSAAGSSGRNGGL